ncbi:hypothetical protein A3F19_01545 [Candidatus Nomurabacteria bacterium RIFCSPHIGHO2_12_FULL_37_29]|uniref:Glycosidase n=2 Tax=Candidatus Nomuraibacteriota TaxID=1752729 RepID=A0A1F6Y5V0_9BACT|nr:MAG: hypothetical protein A2727_00150 [Candidatus Nomurabacteria bacterium RIFCSPHIGHO2_01_FULL_37_110]OGI79381.1 MAG: hypothetical protein A3F19_01545 [Candidatus Nomurabacteria bacterium RIFCSPHIGHO2_12_FULL_37_29]OGI84812.1 MAG: hypothetical protein A3A92_00540 [Candidatus Nomurabacteria bacterium RIFCSPLOWO2_01_FULL_37_49]OGJ01722.1 MAG: hypothetical protein A3G98_02520 [Candidatus Nomurabacteria bacterium RIFCSPLOWO2_12_FULL_37_8]
MVVPKKKKTFKKKVAVKPKKLVTKKAVVKKSRPKKTSVKKKTPLDLKRSLQNPIIQPTEHAWESKATFNPTAFQHDGKIHIIYRAIGDTDNSVLGYAESRNGSTIQESFPRPVYYHFISRNKDKSIPAISYSSGGGWGGGCEDPRITLLGDKVYMLYTAFDGWGSVRIALTSISLNDFLDKCWNWKEPVLISPPGEIHKNWVLFPEKIKGKYAILHSLSPHIMIDYFKSLEELNGSNFIHSVHQHSPLWQARDKLIRGVGPSPVKTKYGWLVLYHKMEKHDTHRYKLWAMITDAQDPTKILYNSSHPILEPDEWYENEGYKSGVIYACGAVVKDGQLFVYYGGADKVSCVATADLEAFLKELILGGAYTLRGKRIKT